MTSVREAAAERLRRHKAAAAAGKISQPYRLDLEILADAWLEEHPSDSDQGSIIESLAALQLEAAMTPEQIIELAGKATPGPWGIAPVGRVISFAPDFWHKEVMRLEGGTDDDWLFVCRAREAAPDYARRLVRLHEIGPGIVRALKDCGYWNEARELGALLEAGK